MYFLKDISPFFIMFKECDTWSTKSYKLKTAKDYMTKALDQMKTCPIQFHPKFFGGFCMVVLKFIIPLSYALIKYLKK